MHDLIVVGAGISGLSLAHLAARKGHSVLVLEQAARPGGCVATMPVAAPGSAPFWLELGTHTLYNSYANLIGLIENCGLTGRIQAREKLPFFLLEDGTPRSLMSRISYPELLASLPRLLTTRKEGNTIAGYYSRILGERNYARVFHALFNAVACQDTSDFGVAYLFKKRPSRRKDYPRSFTLTGGLGALIDALAATPGVTVAAGSGVASVTREDGAFNARLADGTVQAARCLALATPPNVGADLLAGCFPDIAQLLGTVHVNRLFSIGLPVARQDVALPPLAGIVATADRFFSVVSRDVVPHPSFRGFTFHCKADDARANLRRAAEVLGLGAGSPELVLGAEHFIPSLGPGHADHVRRVEAAAAGRNLLLTGNYFGGLSLEDCVARSTGEAARLEALPGC